MKRKLLCLSLLLILALAPSALATEDSPLGPPVFAPYYLEFSGIVQELNPYYDGDGNATDKLFVLTEDSEGALMNFVVDEETLLLTENELQVGVEICGYYLGNRPMIMIYPPQAHAELLAVAPTEEIKAALFDENLLSDDNQLKLNIGPDTKIMLENGEVAPADIELGNRPLAVFYTITTRSLPPQTTPSRIIVLDVEEALPAVSTPQTATLEQEIRDGIALSVENVLLLDAPPIFLQDNGTVMIPLRAVAEALGYQVGWQNGQVLLDGQVMVTIGQEGAELHNGSTYVPLSFFRQTLQLNNAYMMEQQVYIDNGEKME